MLFNFNVGCYQLTTARLDVLWVWEVWWDVWVGFIWVGFIWVIKLYALFRLQTPKTTPSVVSWGWLSLYSSYEPLIRHAGSRHVHSDHLPVPTFLSWCTILFLHISTHAVIFTIITVTNMVPVIADHFFSLFTWFPHNTVLCSQHQVLPSLHYLSL